MKHNPLPVVSWSVGMVSSGTGTNSGNSSRPLSDDLERRKDDITQELFRSDYILRYFFNLKKIE